MPHIPATILALIVAPVNDIPPLSDFGFLPDVEFASWGLSAASACKNHAEKMLDAYGGSNDQPPKPQVAYWRNVLEYANKSAAAYGLLKDAHNRNKWLAEYGGEGWVTETVVRQTLDDLRSLIGSDMYYSGCMPPPVPVWMFSSID
jgi:hypothetical protein